MTSLTRWVLAHGRLVAGFWMIVTVAGLLSAGPASKALKQTFTVPDKEGSKTNFAIEERFGGGGVRPPLIPVVTLPAGTSADSPAVRTGLRDVAARIRRAVPGTRVTSYASDGDRAFLSEDRRTTFVLAHPPPTDDPFGDNPAAEKATRSALRGMTIAGAPVHLTGFNALQSSSGGSDGPGVLLEAIVGGLGALLVLAFVFASLMAFVPLLTAIVSILTTFLVIWGLTTITDVSPIVQFLVALIGLGIAIDYSLLIVVRWREERAHGLEGDEAIVRAMETAGRAVVLSGTTVAVGLLALVVLPLSFLRSIGFGGMLIPLVSVIVSITLLPIVLQRFGARLDWPHVRSDDRASRSWTRWAQLVYRRRVLAALAAITILGALLAAASTLALGANGGDPDTIARKGDAKNGLTALQRSGIGSGAIEPMQVLVRAGTDPARVAGALGRVDGIHDAAAPTGPQWRSDGVAVVEVFPVDDDSSAAGRSTIARVSAAAHALGPGTTVGGIGPSNRDFVDAVYGNFPLMIALIAVLTFVLLARAFRSLLLPLKAVVLNVVSVGAAWGVVALVWQHGHGSDEIWGIAASGSVPPWIPLMVFAFLFGLSMDYEVFILARMREEFDATGSTREAVVRGIGRTGRLVTSAALILFLAFTSMASGPETDVKILATGLAAGILLDATVVRALLVPATVALFGRWNWWLPAWPARLLRVDPSRPAGAEARAG